MDPLIQGSVSTMITTRRKDLMTILGFAKQSKATSQVKCKASALISCQRKASSLADHSTGLVLKI